MSLASIAFETRRPYENDPLSRNFFCFIHKIPLYDHSGRFCGVLDQITLGAPELERFATLLVAYFVAHRGCRFSGFALLTHLQTHLSFLYRWQYS